MEDKIKEVMALVREFGAKSQLIVNASQGEAEEWMAADSHQFFALRAVELKLRELLGSQPNLSCKSVQKRLAKQWGFSDT